MEVSRFSLLFQLVSIDEQAVNLMDVLSGAETTAHVLVSHYSFLDAWLYSCIASAPRHACYVSIATVTR
jgi:hypothetical protein